MLQRFVLKGIVTLSSLVLIGLLAAGPASAGPLSSYNSAQVADIDPGAGSGISNSVDPEFTAAAGQVFFIADDGVNGKELWVSDGKPGGTTEMVKDINPAPGIGSNPTGLTAFEGELYFSASDGTNGAELWKSDGTEAGTVMIKDIQAGGGGSQPGSLTEAGGQLFFRANGGVGFGEPGDELWKTDGTAAGTEMIKDIEADGCYGGSNPRELAAVGNLLYFVANFSVSSGSPCAPLDAGIGLLYKSDGTEAGTTPISDLNGSGEPADPFLQDITDLNGLAIFSANLAATGRELWRSDGTDFQTILSDDIFPGATGSSPAEITVFDGWGYFRANGGPGANRELWRTNGTNLTEPFLDIEPSGQGFPENLTVVNDELWFRAGTLANAAEPWRSDGTPGGTQIAKDINPTGNSFPERFTGLQDRTFFIATSTLGPGPGFEPTNYQLWQSDGTPGGTFARSSVAAGDPLEDKVKWLAKVGSRLVFGADNNDGTGFELWSFADNQEPLTTITSGPANNSTINDPSPVFGFESDDLPATFECRLYDNNLAAPAFGPCSGPGATHTPPAPLTTVNEIGQFRFEVRAIDESGNVDSTPVGRTFTLDVIPPDTEITAGPAEGSTVTDTTPAFEFRAVNRNGNGQSGATFECRLFRAGQSAPAFGACSGPDQTHTPATPLAEGSYTFEVVSTDPTGNTDPTPASRSFAVEGEPAADTSISGSVSARKTQKQRGRKLGIKVTVKADEDLRVVLSGKVVDGRRKPGLKKVTSSLEPGASRTIVLRPANKKKNRTLLARVRRTGKVRAQVVVTLSDQAGNRKQIRLSVKLR